MLSYWERKSFLRYDYIVVGGGITGLSTALSIREKDKEASIIVVDREIIPMGASTRNAGFACFGSLSELVEDMQAYGESRMLHLVESRWKGLEKLKSRVGIESIGLSYPGGYELIREQEIHYLEKIEVINKLLKHIFKINVFTSKPELVGSFGFSRERVQTVVDNPFEGYLHPGRLIKKLRALVQSRKIEILEGTEVNKIDQKEEYCELYLSNPHQPALQLCASKVAVCTNAYTHHLFPDLDVKPARGIIIVTKPINELSLKGSFHLDRGFYYFRDLKNRILLGGGRHTAMDQEQTESRELNPEIINNLKEMLENYIIPGMEYAIEYNWAGTMGFGSEKVPIIKQVSPRIAVGARLSGMGVAMASWVGEEVAKLLTD